MTVGWELRTHLKRLTLIIPNINTIIPLARRTAQLPPIDRNRREQQRARGIHDPAAMLPLQDPARAGGVRRVGDGAVVGFLVVSVAGEGVGDAGVVGLDEFVVDWVVEALAMRWIVSKEWWWDGGRDGGNAQDR